MSALIWIIALVLLGFILLALELLVVPGTTIVGILGVGALGFAVYSSFNVLGSIGGLVALGIIIILGIVMLIWILKAKTWKRISLQTELSGRSSTNTGLSENLEVGQEGICISRLAPMGTVDFDGRYLEVHSNMNFIDEKTKVKIVRIDKNDIFVDKID